MILDYFSHKKNKMLSVILKNGQSMTEWLTLTTSLSQCFIIIIIFFLIIQSGSWNKSLVEKLVGNSQDISILQIWLCASYK